MPQWLEDTKQNIQSLKKKGYFNSWNEHQTELIIFYLCPDLVLPNNWLEQRENVYLKNAEKLRVKAPHTNFYVYPSLEFGKSINVVPATSFVQAKEIHGHLNQSPGHELTHILLGEINPTENLPANGLWSEGVCVYLDGTKTNRHKHANSLNYSEEILITPWQNWRNNLPSNLYPLAGSMLQYLDEYFGWDLILEFLKKLEYNNDNELSIQLFKHSLTEIQQDWYLWLKKEGQPDISG